MTQEQVFIKHEADNWFKRNQEKLNDLENNDEFDWTCYCIDLLSEKNELNNIIELGCSNGWRLHKLGKKNYGRYLVGVDASLEAIQAGKFRYPHLNLHHGVLSLLPTQEEFDLVIVAGVLHCVDRHTLVKSIAEIDRVTKDGGVLIITDFLPNFQQRRQNHHCPKEKIYTYKQDYAKIFESFGIYRQLIRVTSNYGEPGISLHNVDFSAIYGCTVLQKSLHSFYPEI